MNKVYEKSLNLIQCFVKLFLDSYFDEFINCELMSQFKDKIKWIRIDLLGQEENAKTLKIKYVSFIYHFSH